MGRMDWFWTLSGLCLTIASCKIEGHSALVWAVRWWAWCWAPFFFVIDSYISLVEFWSSQCHELVTFPMQYHFNFIFTFRTGSYNYTCYVHHDHIATLIGSNEDRVKGHIGNVTSSLLSWSCCLVHQCKNIPWMSHHALISSSWSNPVSLSDR